MDWFGAGGNGPLVATRALHFAATAITAGTLIFRTVVATPVLRRENAAAAEAFRTETLRVTWISFMFAAMSGAVWLLLQAASMSGMPLGDTSALLTVLNETQFGGVAEIRFVAAIVLTACLAFDRFAAANRLAFAAALSLIASLAWTGHAGSTVGQAGSVHLAADALHLCAAAVWIGGLLSLILFFATIRRTQRSAWASLAREATDRFSMMGIGSVAILSATGIVNAYILVGSFRALMITEYGQLLVLKLVVFAVMLALAATNRLWLTPRLALPGIGALRQLTRNSAIEFALGLVILAIVAMLGTLHPAIHLVK
jgi:copper resistance protein D